jgi:hypothetical protein
MMNHLAARSLKMNKFLMMKEKMMRLSVIKLKMRKEKKATFKNKTLGGILL